ncbi:MAG: hypothetical protein K2Q45_09100 [Nitrosomonas sp.]|nr:hypothetical protein [Nitrosomonas sp.]
MKRGRWVGEKNFDAGKIQCSKYVQAVKCAESNCGIILAYNACGREDDEDEFRVSSCSCDAPALCCTAHVETYVCLYCRSEDEEEEEKEEV